MRLLTSLARCDNLWTTLSALRHEMKWACVARCSHPDPSLDCTNEMWNSVFSLPLPLGSASEIFFDRSISPSVLRRTTGCLACVVKFRLHHMGSLSIREPAREMNKRSDTRFRPKIDLLVISLSTWSTLFSKTLLVCTLWIVQFEVKQFSDQVSQSRHRLRVSALDSFDNFHRQLLESSLKILQELRPRSVQLFAPNL